MGRGRIGRKGSREKWEVGEGGVSSCDMLFYGQMLLSDSDESVRG